MNLEEPHLTPREGGQTSSCYLFFAFRRRRRLVAKDQGEVQDEGYSDTAHAAFDARGAACATHAFPHEEKLLRSVKGVAARPGERRWDSTQRVGSVDGRCRAHLGA